MRMTENDLLSLLLRGCVTCGWAQDWALQLLIRRIKNKGSHRLRKEITIQSKAVIQIEEGHTARKDSGPQDKSTQGLEFRASFYGVLERSLVTKWCSLEYFD